MVINFWVQNSCTLVTVKTTNKTIFDLTTFISILAILNNGIHLTKLIRIKSVFRSNLFTKRLLVNVGKVLSPVVGVNFVGLIYKYFLFSFYAIHPW